MEKKEMKKVIAVFIIVIVSFSVGGAVTILGIGPNAQSSSSVAYTDSNGTGQVNAESGNYTINIQSNTQWIGYIIVDGKYIQKSGDSNTTIDLGHIDKYASITIDQTGIGTTTATILNGNNTIDQDNTNQADTNTLFMYLRM